jgi:dynein heavy chain
MLLSEGETIPWDAMLFVTGHINYGGRVTDDWDRRCLITILKKFITTDILEDAYRFSDNHDYFVPPQQAVSEYIAYIDKLPMTDDPQVFGMHENANITF